MGIGHYLPAVLVGLSFLLNAIIAIRGMNRISARGVVSMTAMSIILAVAAVWMSIIQANEADKSASVMEKIAIANGVDPNETTETIAAKTIKKKLGGEAVQISQDIFKFIQDQRLFDSTMPRPDHWQEDSQNNIERVSNSLREYDAKYSAKTLSWLERANKTKIITPNSSTDDNFKDPTNPPGIRDAGIYLGKTGELLLEEAK